MQGKKGRQAGKAGKRGAAGENNWLRIGSGTAGVRDRMLGWQTGFSRRAFRSVLILAVSIAASLAHSAPLLHAYPQGYYQFNTWTRSIATDGTNLLLALYSETSRSISTALIRPDGSSVWGYETAQLPTPPQVAFNGTTYLTAWVEDPGAAAQLHGRFINRSGVLMASKFLVLAGLDASGVTGLTWDGAGFLVLWASSLEGHSVVRGQRLGPDGMPIGSVLDISSPGATATNSASAGKGNHLVVWMESTGATNQWQVRARALMSDGSLSEVSTLSSSPVPTSNPLCLSFGDGDAMAIWSREVGPYTIPCNGSTSNYWLNLFGRVLAEDGSSRGAEFQITSIHGRQTDPKIAFDGTNYLVAWTDSRFGVCNSWTNYDYLTGFAQQISRSGTVVNPEFRPLSRLMSRAGPVAFAGGQFLYISRDCLGDPCSFYDDLVFLRSGGLGTGFFRKLVPETNGYFQVDFTANNERGRFYLQASTNFIDWQFVDREDGPYASIFTDRVTRFVEPFPGDRGGRFFRAVNTTDVCVSNLLLMNHVKAVWASANGKSINAPAPTDSEIFGPGRYLPIKPTCPNGGTYYLDDFANRPTCTLSAVGHSL